MPDHASFNSKWACSTAVILVYAALALSVAPAVAQVFDPISGCYGSAGGVISCNGYPGSGSAPAQGPRIGYDPCYLAQNALRPCNSGQGQTSKPVGVDSHLVGTWEIPFKGGPWVLSIRGDGTYKFRSEAKDGAPPSSGTFSAGNGHWSMKATTGYSDTGFYLFQAPDLWIATGRLGAAAWLRPASARNALRPCPSGPPQTIKATGVDSHLVGTWKLPFKGGPWVWEIFRDGSYKFHSEAQDGAPSHSGTFSASNGQWSLKATTGYTDNGHYLFQAPDIFIASGKLGAAAWLRPSSSPLSCKGTP